MNDQRKSTLYLAGALALAFVVCMTGCFGGPDLPRIEGELPQKPPSDWSVSDVVQYVSLAGAGIGAALLFGGIVLLALGRPTLKLILAGLAMVIAASILGILIVWLKVAAWLAVICSILGAIAYGYLHRKVAIMWLEKRSNRDLNGDGQIGDSDG